MNILRDMLRGEAVVLVISLRGNLFILCKTMTTFCELLSEILQEEEFILTLLAGLFDLFLAKVEWQM